MCFILEAYHAQKQNDLGSVWSSLWSPMLEAIMPKNKMILQAEAGGGEREAFGRKTRRPEPWFAGQPRRLHAPVHQVGDAQVQDGL